jgi:hypothetical protein
MLAVPFIVSVTNNIQFVGNIFGVCKKNILKSFKFVARPGFTHPELNVALQYKLTMFHSSHSVATRE